MQTKVKNKMEDDPDEVNPEKLIEIGDQVLDEVFKERAEEAKLYDSIIRNTSGNVQKIVNNALISQKDGDSLAKVNLMTKKFKGLSMAANIASHVLVKRAKIEKDQIRLEHEHLESIKQAFGFDL